MKALVYTGTREMDYMEQPDPVLSAGDALVTIEAVGICGSDMHAYHGHDPRRVPPLVLGHEAAGTVSGGQHDGQRVILNPLMVCGHCDYCAGGRSNLCGQRRLIGMNSPGAFAEQIAIPATNLIPIPDSLTALAAALTEPAATALHALALAKRASPRPLAEGPALVIGGGSIGLLAALWLAHFGCNDVVLAEINPLRRASAAATGSCKVIDPLSETPPAEHFSLVLDAVGSPKTRQTAIAAVAPGGILMHVGLQENGGDFDARKLTLAEVTFIGTYTYTPVDLRATVAALAENQLGNLNWVEQRSLQDGAKAFSDLDLGQTGAAKIVLLP